MALLEFKAEDRFEAVIVDLLEKLGVTLTVGTDFHEFREYVEAARSDHPLGDPFDPDVHDMNASNSRWIVGRDRNGKIMHLHALRLLPTEGATVADYFRRNFHGFSPPELDIDFERSRYRACPAAKRMSGRIVYSGEVWIGGEPGEYRGTGLIGFLMRYAMLTAMRELSADYFLGFVTLPQAIKGLTLRFGYMHVDPMALRWFQRGQDKPLEGTMVYAAEEDIRYIMDLPASELEALAA
ncbi:hypothetical protein E4Z66_14500 [Aliishimia ponticola]|uniref:GNAT family N-acetyltransferase n=1 Tax=Aliishimia ponticola TaxID=2499833 RepID=A0A4S4N7H3_9RHOB|nr:hypothetical protein [Aliishimia ponticola]THH35039.1 hypothetical protein E4Z66_14500 [Aliishimia ponticola]